MLVLGAWPAGTLLAAGPVVIVMNECRVVVTGLTARTELGRCRDFPRLPRRRPLLLRPIGA